MAAAAAAAAEAAVAAAAAAAGDELSPLREAVALPPLLHLLEQPHGRHLVPVARQAYTDFNVCATRMHIKALEGKKDELWSELVDNGVVYGELDTKVRNANDQLVAAGRLEAQDIVRERQARENSMDYINDRNGYILMELVKIDRKLSSRYETLAREAAEQN